MLKVCSVKDLLFHFLSARVKSRSRPVARPFLFRSVSEGNVSIDVDYVIFIDPL